MWRSDRPIGLVAGEGQYPLLVAKALIAAKKTPVIFGIEGCFDRGIESYAQRVISIPLGGVENFVNQLKASGVKQLILAGAIPKKEIFNPKFLMDETAKKIIERPSNRGDDHLLRALQVFLKVRCGVSILDARPFLKESLCPKGLLTQRKLTESEKRDLAFGWKIARGIGKMDIGQTVVVKHGVVLAVEALEGTNQAILRGGDLGGADTVVVKRTKPGQNLRFDLPSVGPETIQTLRASGACVLGLEAHKTLLVSKEEMIHKAQEARMSLVGL